MLSFSEEDRRSLTLTSSQNTVNGWCGIASGIYRHAFRYSPAFIPIQIRRSISSSSIIFYYYHPSCSHPSFPCFFCLPFFIFIITHLYLHLILNHQQHNLQTYQKLPSQFIVYLLSSTTPCLRCQKDLVKLICNQHFAFNARVIRASHVYNDSNQSHQQLDHNASCYQVHVIIRFVQLFQLNESQENTSR